MLKHINTENVKRTAAPSSFKNGLVKANHMDIQHLQASVHRNTGIGAVIDRGVKRFQDQAGSAQGLLRKTAV